MRISENFDVLYRVESHNFGLGYDQFDEQISGHHVVLRIDMYEVIKRTPKGAWIKDYTRAKGKRFILLTARKQFATNTIDEAKSQFYHRKIRYLSILRSKISDTEIALSKLEILK